MEAVGVAGINSEDLSVKLFRLGEPTGLVITDRVTEENRKRWLTGADPPIMIIVHGEDGLSRQ